MLFDRFLKRTVATLLAIVLIISFVLPSCTVNAKENEDLSVSLNYGYSGYVDCNSYAPFIVDVQNKGEDFEGSVWLVFTYEEGKTYAYEQKISLPSGSAKKVSFVPLISEYISVCTIRITDKKGREVKSKTFPVNCEMYTNAMRVGILSDDYTIFGAKLTGTYLPFNHLELIPVSLSEDNILDDPKSLSPLSVMIISDYSTDRLTTAQRQAIMSNVANGALLIVGTGTSAQKVLKAFPELSDIKLDELRSVDITFPVSLVLPHDDAPDYQLMSDLGCNYDTRLDYLCKYLDPETFDAPDVTAPLADSDPSNDYLAWEYLYNNNTDAFIAAFFDWHSGKPYDIAKIFYLADEFRKICADFRNYAVNTLCSEALNYYRDNILPYVENNDPQQSDFIKTYITEPLSGDRIINGHTPNGEAYYTLATKIKYGSGYICPVALDLSKEPYSTSKFFSANIAQIISDTIASNFASIQSRGIGSFISNRFDWQEYNLSEKLAVGNLIPLPAYLIIFVVYVVLGFVAYFYLRKKNRSIYLWAVQGILALSATALVMLTGLTTRMSKPVVNALKFTEISDNVVQETTISTVILPKTKKYILKLKEEYLPQTIFEGNYHFSSYRQGNLAAAPKGEYSVAFLDEKDCNALSFYNTAALSKRPLCFSVQKDIKDYRIDIDAKYSAQTLVGHVTNNSEFTLEGCTILMDYIYYPIGTLAPGETIDLSTVTPRSTMGIQPDLNATRLNYYINTSRFRAYKEVNYTRPDNFTSYFVGFNRSEHTREYLKNAAIEYLLSNQDWGLSQIPVYTDVFYRSYSFAPQQFNSVRELFEYLNLDPNGHPMQLTATPYFIAFNGDEPSSLFSDNSSAKENLLEVFYKALPSIIE